MFPQRSPLCPLMVLVNGLGEGSNFQAPRSNHVLFAVPQWETWERLCKIHLSSSVVLGKESEST